MLSHYMNLIKRQIIPVAAMLVAFVWASYVAGPAQGGNPLPLPTDYAATSATDVVAD